MMNLLMNPKAWIALLAAAFIAFVAFTFHENGNLKADLKTQQQTISQLQTDAEVLRKGQSLIKTDIQRLDDLAQAKQTIIIRETELNRDLDEIPETEDRPFADSNNLAYAQRLRDYQHNAIGSDPTN